MIFSTIRTFQEQVGRRKIWRYGDLDQMVCIWNGPNNGALGFKPKVNAPHPEYPLMFCTSSEIGDQAALVSEIRATYEGIIQSGGASKYMTSPIFSVSPIQGSMDYQTGYIAPIALAPGAGQAAFAWSYGTQQVTIRWVGQQASVKYQAYPEPTEPTYSNLGLAHANFTINYTKYGIVNIAGSALTEFQALDWVAKNVPQQPSLENIFAGFSKEQRGLWWNCMEVYSPMVLGA